MIIFTEEQVESFEDAMTEYASIVALNDLVNQLTVQQVKHIAEHVGLKVVEDE